MLLPILVKYNKWMNWSIKETLMFNVYPVSMIRSHTLPSKRHDTTKGSVSSTAIICLPFLPGTYEALKRILECHIFRVVLEPCYTSKHLFLHPKDAIKDGSKANVVCNITICGLSCQLCQQDLEKALDARVKQH